MTKADLPAVAPTANASAPAARSLGDGALAPSPLQLAMIRAARNGDAPWANLEQLVIHDPAPVPPAHVVARALDTLARRHPGLRLVAADGPDGEPVLVPRARFVPAMATCDWSALTPQAQEAALADWLARDRAAGIDLTASPGWRVLLADLGRQGHACVLVAHHALLDGPSLARVAAELCDLVEGRPPAGPPPPGPRDFAAALAGLSEGSQARAAALLSGFDRPTRLTAPGARAAGRMQSAGVRLGRPVAQALHERARSCGGTFALVQAVWALLLARWTGEDDVAFGLTLGGRNLIPGFEATVGCLIATLPQRVPLADLPDLDTLALRLRTRTAELRRLHAASADDLRRWAGLAPGMPLFDHVLVFSRTTVGRQAAALGCGWERRRAQLHEEGDMPLTVAVYDEPDLPIEFEFDPTAIAPARARQLLDHFGRLLAAAAAAPAGAPLGSLAMLAPAEAARLDRLARPDRAADPAPADLAAAIFGRARQRPGAPALIDGALRLSRASLAGRARALAHRMMRAVPPDGRVALSLPRGADYAAAVLAGLAARRTVVPLDPAMPAELRAELARAAGVAALVAPEALPGLPVPLLAPDAAEAAVAPDLPAPGPDAPAYVIHTSGSTGRPKGVIGRHGALAAHAAAIVAAYGLTPADRVLAVAAPGFDVALEELLPTLLAGAAVVVAGPEAMGSVGALLELVAAERVSVLNLPASLWHLLTDEMARCRLALPPSVRLVVTGSERVAPGALALWQRLAPGVRWINAYGPTEATITALAYPVEAHAPPVDPGAEVPIGRPLAHATARVLAFDGSDAPEGAPGQLWIGGEAVTLGYLDRPDETAAAFCPDPGGGPGARRYATGDRVRWRPDGALEFLGRRDRQIKLRGHRIDIEGVERALGALDGVRAVHVAADPSGGRLIAWVDGPVAQDGPEAAARLRAAAARRLSGPALPVLVVMAALPLRPNGKIDPSRLPPPPAGPARPAALPPALRAAGPGAERVAAVAAVFAEVLSADEIDPDADFRDLGGHSLAALKLAGAIESRFGRRTRTTDLYRNPTARLMAAHLDAPASGPHYVVPIQPHGTGVPFFAVHVLGEKEGLFRPLAAALGPDRPVLGLTMGPPRDPDAVRVETVAQAYFEDIQRHYPTGPLALGAVSMAAYFAFDLAQRLLAAGRDVRLLAVLDAEGPGGRPALRGRAKLAAHLRQMRRRGTGHLWSVLRARLDRLRFARDLALSGPDTVNGAVLVLANVRAVEAYRPQPYPGRIAVFRAAESFWDSPEAIAQGLGWAAVARGGLDCIDVPGNHLTILETGNVEALAAHLSRLLPPE